MSKYDTEICPYCEKPMAVEANDEEAERRWLACGKNDDDPDLKTWESQYCWNDLYSTGCMDLTFEERLIQVLEQRDALAAQLAEKLGA